MLRQSVLMTSTMGDLTMSPLSLTSSKTGDSGTLEQQAYREAGLDDAGVLALGLPRCMLVAHQDGTAPFGAERQALHDADEYQQGGGQQPNLAVGGQQADQEGGHTHQDQRRDQHGLAAHLVAEVAADDAAQRAGREADAQGGEGGQRARDRIAGGEECSAEVQRGGGAETNEVIGLDDCAHTGANGNALGVLGSVNRTAHVQSIFAHGGSLSESG
jgi:hypothetical protein